MPGYVAELRHAIEKSTPLPEKMGDEATRLRPGSSVDPISYEDVRLVRVRIVTVRGPDDLLAVRAEHRESIKSGRRRHLLERGAIRLDQKEIEVAELGIGVMVGGEHDPLAIGRPRRAEARRTEMSDLALIAPISVN